MKTLNYIMKKARFLILLAIIGMVCTTACKKDDPDPIPVPTPTEKPNPDEPQPGPTPESEPEKVDTIKIVSIKVTPSNLVGDFKGFTEITFNHPILMREIKGHWLYTDFDPEYELSEDFTTLKIKLPFYAISEYPEIFNMKVSDRDLKRIWPQSVEISSYNHKFIFEGRTKGYYADYERETIWLATEFPCRLYRFSMSDIDHPTYRDFAVCPNVLTVNPYNNKLYVGSTVTTYEQNMVYDRKMYVLDPTTLDIEDSFTISFESEQNDPDTQYPYPDASPLSIAFTNDGFGLLVRQNCIGNGTDLCYIDSRDGHKLTIDDCWENWYCTVETRYGGEELILKHQPFYSADLNFISRNNPTPRIYTVENKWRSDEYYAGGNTADYKIHRSESKYLIQGVQSMVMIDYETDTYSPVFVEDTRGAVTEFDYNNDYHAMTFNEYFNLFLYVDMRTAQPLRVLNFTQGEQEHEIKYAGHNPQRDVLIIAKDYNDSSYTQANNSNYCYSVFYTVDMKYIRTEESAN